MDETPEPTGEPTEPTGTETVVALLDELVAALVNTRIYEADHPRVTGSLVVIRSYVEQLQDERHLDPLELLAVDDMFVFDEKPLFGASMSGARLANALEARGSGGIAFHRDVSASELGELFRALADRDESASYETINARLERTVGSRARLLAPCMIGEGGAERPRSDADFAVPVKFYQSVIDMLQEVTIGVCSGGNISFDGVSGLADEMLDRLDSTEGQLLNLARQDQYDAFTFGHSVRVAILALNFGRALTDDKEFLVRLGTAALLHDVGKSLIPFEVLHSRTPLDAEQREVMNRHPQLGAQILLDHSESDPMAVTAAFGHHRTRGEQAYPKTAHQHRLGTVSEMIKLCDVYEALTAARPYKEAMPPIRAYRIMIGMADAFDRRLLRRFIEVIGAYPSGQLVELGTGEQARVIRQTADPFAPTVRVITDADGNPLDHDDQPTIELCDPACDSVRAIIRAATTDRFVTAEG